MVDAAAVVLWRDTGARLELFVAQRSHKLRFMGGYFAFPGGVVDDADRADGADEARVLARCAVRELREEVGVALDVASLVPLSRIVTPPFAPVRYDTRFFLARVPTGAAPSVEASGGELVAGRFIGADDALLQWKRGELPLAPPVVLLIECCAGRDLDGFRAAASALAERHAAGKLPDMRFTPGVRMMSLKTPTLPPATTTNAFLVGVERRWLIEPAPVDVTEQDRLVEAIVEERDAGRPLAGVLLTHHHPDHVGAAARISKEFGVGVRAHPLTLARLPDGTRRGAPLIDGDEIDLGRAPDGTPGWTLRAIATPGHAIGHLCFRESRYRSLFAGDMVSTVSTIVIDPPEGHMATYLASLARLRTLDLGTIYPAHGPPALDGPKLLERFVTHRAERESRLAAALAEEPSASAESLLPKVYADVDARMHPIALRSLLAGIEKLRGAMT